MSSKFAELKRKIEKCNNINLYDLLGEIVEAYEKGEIESREYIALYELSQTMNQGMRKE